MPPTRARHASTPWSSPFAPTYERLRDDPRWTVHAAAGAGHNLMRDAPDVLVTALLDAAA